MVGRKTGNKVVTSDDQFANPSLPPSKSAATNSVQLSFLVPFSDADSDGDSDGSGVGIKMGVGGLVPIAFFVFCVMEV